VVPRGADLVGRVTHVRDGDTIEVSGVPVRIANLDCAELSTAAGNHANAVMRRWATRATASCQLEGRMSYDRHVGVCSIDGVGDLGEAMIRAGACTR
jgi:endonuclease YncB( thermonuclease family)